jgi:hypothetical protein
MAKRNMKEKLIDKSEIQEELRLIKGSLTDYITPSGEIYKDYGNNKFYHKAQWTTCGYWYCGITYPEGQRQRRVHILVAEVYVPNPDPEHNTIVLHLDSNKENKHYTNLKWGTISENTKQAFDEGMAHNDKSWDDSQSIHVCQFDLKGNLLKRFGSVSEASRELGITKTAILNQCNHNIKTKPRCGFWFRYMSEYDKEGFVL